MSLRTFLLIRSLTTNKSNFWVGNFPHTELKKEHFVDSLGTTDNFVTFLVRSERFAGNREHSSVYASPLTSAATKTNLSPFQTNSAHTPGDDKLF